MTRALAIAFVLALALALSADFALKATGKAKGEFWGAELPAYWAALGFSWCVLTVLISKAFGRYWVERDEDYYDEGESDEHE
ncbi:MAG: hypothetical protein ACOC5K_02745 [Chloroflexota bacterium]